MNTTNQHGRARRLVAPTNRNGVGFSQIQFRGATGRRALPIGE
jgi:hypothetical protein